MTNTVKAWVAIIVVVLAGLAGWMWYSNMPENSSSNSQSTVSSSDQNATTTMSATNDTSNTALEQDLNASNAQLNNLNSDTSNADQSLNGQSSQ